MGQDFSITVSSVSRIRVSDHVR